MAPRLPAPSPPPAPPPLKRGHNARSRGPPNHFPSWNSFSFVLKVNKIGQQGKYFYSRKNEARYTGAFCRGRVERQYGFGRGSAEQILQLRMLQSVTRRMQDGSKRAEEKCTFRDIEDESGSDNRPSHVVCCLLFLIYKRKHRAKRKITISSHISWERENQWPAHVTVIADI